MTQAVLPDFRTMDRENLLAELRRLLRAAYPGASEADVAEAACGVEYNGYDDGWSYAEWCVKELAKHFSGIAPALAHVWDHVAGGDCDCFKPETGQEART